MRLLMNDYPRTWNPDVRRWSYKHREVMQELLGRPLRPDEHVHHKDHDPKNFSADNLVVLSPSEHILEHPPARKNFEGCLMPGCPNHAYLNHYCREHYILMKDVIGAKSASVENHPTCVVLIAEKNGLVLATSRKTNHNDFGLPGGKVEDGETPEQAMVRECMEETGLRPFSLQKVYEGRNMGYPVIVYKGKVVGEPHTQENLKVAWVDWQKVLAGSFGGFNRQLYNLVR